MSDSIPSPTDSATVRNDLAQALSLDLVGPWAGHTLADERLPDWVRPSNWYLTGFLVPTGTPAERRSDHDEDDDLDEAGASGGLPEESTEDRKAAKRSYFPSSMGLSFLVDGREEALTVTVRWGDYHRAETVRTESDPTGEAAGEQIGEGGAKPSEGGDSKDEASTEGVDSRKISVWQRTPQERTVSLPLSETCDQQCVPDSDGLSLHLVKRPLNAQNVTNIPAGTRSVNLFLVNQRQPHETDPDTTYAFQAELEVRGALPFVPRPDLRRAGANNWDDQVADLHYADAPEYAAGHGVSVDWDLKEGACRLLRTAWIPQAEVAKTNTVDVPGVELSMAALGDLADGAAARAALEPLATQYRGWIKARQSDASKLSDQRRSTAEELLRRALVAAQRIEQGVSALASDADALDAFRVANRAVMEALWHRLPGQFDNENPPKWRAFQLAFMLLNLPGMVDPEDASREIVDLLFFPTGGGKTEAYFGLAAFAMVLRRLRNPGSDGRQGAGVSVIMRYTLRLLTLDQLSRAAGLVCALELERENDPERYGSWPFEIGLWVGKAATPNRMGQKGDKRRDTARSNTRHFKRDPSRPSPIPLENCPWCGEKFTSNSFDLRPNADAPKDLRVVCVNIDCDFSGDRPLPIVAVDEPIYRRLPAFLISTVDKFATLPWLGQSGLLLGGADRYDGDGFHGAATPQTGKPLEGPLLPPDLVIQDELHLIAGPLGTMVGLYESAIEALCLREVKARPKIVASTATTRQADDQIQALFGRSETHMFPPAGPNRRDTFFARTAGEETAGRLYLGIVAPGRNAKVMMRKTWLALMGAAQRAYLDAGDDKNEDNPADPYMTALGYFNSLRELGGARRILEEEVRHTVRHYGERKRIGEARGLFRSRRSFSEVVELTSRVPTNKVAEARNALARRFQDGQGRVDCAIATNMISVGLDIPRLGLMLVLGQPKAHAEYIQATSRIGRDDQRPGLVVTLLNVYKPRDRSHYERFRHYHETFYRDVEASSVTPFSARALDRGFAGALVSFARHQDGKLTPANGAERIEEAQQAGLRQHLLDAFLWRVSAQPIRDEAERAERRRNVEERVDDLLESWRKVIATYHSDNVKVAYQRFESSQSRQRRPLLRDMLDADFESPQHRRFRVNRSLRDVEPNVQLILKDLTGNDVDEA